jgi:hypothetical protein
VEILEDEQQRLKVTFFEQYALDGVEGAYATLRWIEITEGAVVRNGFEKATGSAARSP